MSVVISSLATQSATSRGRLDLLGVNTAGASFGNIVGNDDVGTTHFYVSHKTIDYFASNGMDVIRLDLKWERIQPKLADDLNETEMRYVDDIVAYAESKGIAVDISLHNYGKFGDNLIGSNKIPTSAFADVWGKLAQRYSDSPNAIFGLMNEPHAHSATEWLPIANAAIKAIRDAGATQEILVPGTYWDGAHSWVSTDNDTVIGTGVVDPLRNFAFEVHQYLDRDSSGTHFNVTSETVGVDRLKAITAWAEQTNNRLFLGEFAAGTDPTSLKALDNMLAYMTEHSQVWQGGTYWAAGEHWGDYPFAVQPIDGQDRPQMAILNKYVSPQTVPYWEMPTDEADQTIGTGSDTLVLKVSQDAYMGNAQFKVSVDGRQVGGTLEAHGSRSDGAYETIAVKGNWNDGQHKVDVKFLNDLYHGSSSTDRNLYVDGATYNGESVAGSQVELLSNESRSIIINDDTSVTDVLFSSQTIGTGSDTLVLKVSQDAYMGNAQFTVSVDGRQVGGTLEAHGSRSGGAYETIAVKGDWNVGQHKVDIKFLNDLYHGSSATDRNLYVDGATYNGASVAESQVELMSNESRSIIINDSTSLNQALPSSQIVGTGSDTLVLKVSQDAYMGNAQFTVSVDGRQVGGTLEAHGSRSGGAYETIAVKGDWNVGQHKVDIKFLNDLYHGSSATDRNLYVDGATYNGASVAESQVELLSNESRFIEFFEM